jgi:hypothetical protein
VVKRSVVVASPALVTVVLITTVAANDWLLENNGEKRPARPLPISWLREIRSMDGKSSPGKMGGSRKTSWKNAQEAKKKLGKISWRKEPKENAHTDAIHAFICSMNDQHIMRLRAYIWGGGRAWQWYSPLMEEFNVTEHCVHAQTPEEAKEKALLDFHERAIQKFGLLIDVLGVIADLP